MTQTQASDLGGPRPVGRLGPFFAGIWLFFLFNPLVEGLRHFDSLGGVIGTVFTVVFAIVYMALWVRARDDRGRMIARPALRLGLAYIATLAAIATVMIVALGEPGIASIVYIGVAGVMVLPWRGAGALVVTLVVGVIISGVVSGDASDEVGIAFGVMAASVAVAGLRAVMTRNVELIAAQHENAELAVEHERTRFARDLHDILGHSLTVITVKAELARRVFDSDPERARSELVDLERLSRDALADVRRAVEGYRDLTLPGELARARIALDAAEIAAVLPNSTDEVPSDLRDLFAWTVREGVTNVIRHSGASTCQVVLTAASAEVRDDGAGCVQTGSGSGLTGLRERAVALGATLVTRDLQPGYSLSVVRP